MSNEEILYDDVAMENVHLLLVTANSKLILARDTYNSDKLSGAELVNETESFMDEVTAGLNRYNHAADEIYTGNVMNMNFFADVEEIEETGIYLGENKNSKTFSDSNEVKKENVREQEIQKYLSFFEERISCIDKSKDSFKNTLSKLEEYAGEYVLTVHILEKYLYRMIPEELDLNNGFVNIDELIEFLEKEKNVNINEAEDIEITIQKLKSYKDNSELKDGSIEIVELITNFENARVENYEFYIDIYQSKVKELDEVSKKLIKARDKFLELSKSIPEHGMICDYAYDFFRDLTEENLRYFMEYGGFSKVTKKMGYEISRQWGIDAESIANGFRTAISGGKINCYNAHEKTFESNLIGMILAAEINGSIKYRIGNISYDIPLSVLEGEVNNSSDWRVMDLLTIHLARNLLYEYWGRYNYEIQGEIDKALSSVNLLTKQEAHDKYNMINSLGWTYKGENAEIYIVTDYGEGRNFENVLPTIIHEVGHRIGGVGGTGCNLEEGINDWILVNIVRIYVGWIHSC